MKTLIKNHRLLPVSIVVGLSLLSMQTTQASSSFASDAKLTYSINSITNLNNPNSLTGLDIQGGFEQAGAPYSFAITEGDGSVTANNSSVIPIGVSASLIQKFTASGNVNNGSVTSSHLGSSSLIFNNTGSDSYSIGVTLDYQLNASASGENADSDVFLDYFNSDNSFTGSDHINASAFDQTNATQSGTSGLFSFMLGPNAVGGLYTNVTIKGNLQASPVPLPGAVWLFGSVMAGMGVIGRRKHKTSAEAYQ